MENKVPYELISKHLAAETSSEEDEMLWQWVEADPLNTKLFQELTEAYISQPELKTKWARYKHDVLRSFITTEKARPHKTLNLFWKIAAGIMLLCLAGIYLFQNRELPITITQVSTGPGEIKEILLPDSSRIWLNSNTTIHYFEKDFSENRKVKITGEAFFRITNKANTFQIEYDSVILQAQSGEYNVQSYPDRNERIATVSGGSASFIDLRKENLVLKSTTGQQVVSLTDYGILSMEINTDLNFNAWLTGTYVFDQTPAGAVAAMVSKDQGIKLHIPEKELRYQTLTGIYEAYSVEELLKQLMIDLNARVEIRNKDRYLVRNTNS